MLYVIATGGKQYLVSPATKLKIEKLTAAPDTAVTFDKILLIAAGDDVKIGAPYIIGATISAKVIGEGRAKKKIIFRYHNKTRRRRKLGHRQFYTEISIP